MLKTEKYAKCKYSAKHVFRFWSEFLKLMLKLSVLMDTHEQRESRKAFVVIELNGNHHLAWSFYLHGRQFLVMLRDLGNVPEVELSFVNWA